MSIRVLLVDDHEVVRSGLRAILNVEPDMEVIAEADNGDAAVQMAMELLPDVVVMDICMPGMNGIDATRRVIDETNGVRVLVFSGYSDTRNVFAAFRAGANGYLVKDCAFGEIARAIRSTADDKHYLSPSLSGSLIADYLLKCPDVLPTSLALLSDREKEVLKRIADGESMKEIAFALEVSVKAIESRRQQIMNKLDLRSVAELTKYAVREGLSVLD